LGSEVVVMANGLTVDPLIVRGRVIDLACAGLSESVTVNVSGAATAAAAGVPVIMPVAAFSDKPVGNVPEVSDQEYGVVPPVAESVAL
jgi:hypothetical protein